MLTIWFLIGAIVATFITLSLYFAARWLDSIMAYAGMVILPLIFNIIAWAILSFMLDVPIWYLAGALLAIMTAFVSGVLMKFVSPGWAYLVVFIMPLAVSVAGWLAINIFIKLWGVYHA